ncbi:MAG: hypothetical protein BGO43_04935 [Gammaproteobacteria bacterium 39-13]|nr:hypothetical protein [Gammaproteobacteria bacterium]OJV96197.1 MAG: hypothetical protein BGO43_04935 [Gammaproteobacteria bacterium 39-13]
MSSHSNKKLFYAVCCSILWCSPYSGIAHEGVMPEINSGSSYFGHGFNPQLSVMLNGGFTWSSFDADNYYLPGFQRGNEASIMPAGFAINEAEVNIQSNIDPYFRGNLTIALHQDSHKIEFEMEEAFIETLSLPLGLRLKAGRFFSGIGYLNYHHTDQWDFADPPLVYRAFFNNQYFDDGVQATWIAPVPFYWEIGTEVFPGRFFPAAGSGNHIGSASIFSHIGDDFNESHSWQWGVSYLHTKPSERQAFILGDHGHGHPHDHDTDHHHHSDSYNFSGSSSTIGTDLIWKWAPFGNARERQLILQTELYHRHEDGIIALDEEISSLHSHQNGWYGQAIYKFMPRWRVGYRYDRLWSNNDGGDEEVLTETLLLPDSYHPYQNTFMIDFSPSEFSRIRLQYNLDHSQPILNKQTMLQFIVNMGSHGAHPF